jgi:hypothetical protein
LQIRHDLQSVRCISRFSILPFNDRPESNTVDFLLTILAYGAPYTVTLLALLLAMLRQNPRLLLQDYPKDVRAAVPAKTPAEKRASLYWSAAFLFVLLAFPIAAALASRAAHRNTLEIFLSASGVAFLFNLADLLILDWLVVCTITPRFVLIPGTEGMAGYKDYGMHLRAFLIGTVFSAILGLLITGALAAADQLSAANLA